MDKKIYFVKLSKSDLDNKYYKMEFFNRDKKKIKTVNFGDPTGNQYIKHQDDNIKNNYIKRHEVRENFNDPLTAGALSRWILWNKKTLSASYNDYLNRFNLKTL